ncbi:hypothetical protein F9C07_2286664 [Aspergillus flavus]|uniref:Uncharacterized protein n=1 Tax=Aspergillus flavus (strain ATCC 200026 / FGSC A1120 / IAM 13836 / NRRL 3357 / JCM 12722 / SRRC 167) TaxID=332952 RepID=A0A7U2R3C6_ASPFN|nr:hypothetical protein F9C07_2286664 [Aspergillus flavus]
MATGGYCVPLVHQVPSGSAHSLSFFEGTGDFRGDDDVISAGFWNWTEIIPSSARERIHHSYHPLQ